MNTVLKETIWSQFGAAIDMLENAIDASPEELWGNRSRQPEFWYIAYHTLFWLDFYSSESSDGFNPPPPFTLSEFDEEGILPERVYSKEEVKSYLEHGRKKCRERIETLTDEKAAQHFVFYTLDLPSLEMILYNMRHVQHHTAQLNLLLRQNINSAPRWVRRSKT